MAHLHLSLDEFYDYAPIEIHYALTAYYDGKEVDRNSNWEQIRLQIYYSYLLTPSSKDKVSFKIFKKDYLPFAFDEGYGIETPEITDDQFGDIQDYFKKIEGTT